MTNDRSVDVNKMVPLTLDQLREKVDEPVYLYIYNSALDSGWQIIKQITDTKILFRHQHSIYVPIGGIGKSFDLYAYPPAHIDRESWKSCEFCRGDKEKYGLKYCQNCGRPLTPEAWDELEKRLGVMA